VRMGFFLVDCHNFQYLRVRFAQVHITYVCCIRV
jgi:hypothetical protein